MIYLFTLCMKQNQKADTNYVARNRRRWLMAIVNTIINDYTGFFFFFFFFCQR